jgi:sec-independent protein translocase protein TatC
VLFLMGAALVYYVMLPYVMVFSLGQQIEGVTQYLPRVDDYLKLATGLVLAMGLCFQLPVILTLLGLAGLVGSATLMSGWRYAVVGVFAVAAVVTPPDPISMMSLALPICLLYFVSVWCVKLVEGRRKGEDADAG